ncbi:hypothetical protein KIS1582_4190 [Cytobacillus firmus]|uniref:Uncharacterized protein n=1 Tax=Cytobacillus firmus TaxID=1399 RepID=A0A800N8Z7_CYTFI|nr:hypothetical protein KIS1582_4190 [Cytobacillus firmus]
MPSISGGGINANKSLLHGYNYHPKGLSEYDILNVYITN